MGVGPDIICVELGPQHGPWAEFGSRRHVFDLSFIWRNEVRARYQISVLILPISCCLPREMPGWPDGRFSITLPRRSRFLSTYPSYWHFLRVVLVRVVRMQQTGGCHHYVKCALQCLPADCSDMMRCFTPETLRQTRMT